MAMNLKLKNEFDRSAISFFLGTELSRTCIYGGKLTLIFLPAKMFWTQLLSYIAMFTPEMGLFVPHGPL